MILPRRKLLRLAAPALILPHRRANAQGGMMPGPGTPHTAAACPGGSTFALIASTHIAGNSGGTTPAIDTTCANLLITVMTTSSSGVAPTDSRGNTWTLLPDYGSPNSYICYSTPTSVGSGHTFTISNGFSAMQVTAWSGAASSSPFDVQTGNFSPTAGPLTPSQNNSLLITGFSTSGSGIPSVSGGFTISSYDQASAGVYFGSASAYLIQTTAVSATATWSIPTGAGCSMAAFKP